MNALAAIRAASLYGARAEDVAHGLAAIRPLSGRSEFLRGKVSVVNDCYNANAESMLAALSFCDDADLAGRRIYVLGSMKELGDESPEAHRKLGLRAARSKADSLFFFGEEAYGAYQSAKEASFPGALLHFSDFDALAAAFRRELREGDTVLLKASRSMALERLLDVIKDFGGTHVS
jgi:UDP-N-acetylmuramoyl-tripeptide--D-alanyl-D-alanine ligase